MKKTIGKRRQNNKICYLGNIFSFYVVYKYKISIAILIPFFDCVNYPLAPKKAIMYISLHRQNRSVCPYIYM